MAAKKSAKKAAKAAKSPAKAPAEKSAAKKAPSGVKKKAAAAKAVKKAAPPPDAIAREAYLNYRRRVEQGLPGDSHADWIEAERQLRADA